MPNDNELIALFTLNQDIKAFTVLVKRYQGKIRQFLRRLSGGNHALADDVAQETFLLMYRKLHTFNGQSAFSTWLHKIAYHCYLHHQQKNKYPEPPDWINIEDRAAEQADASADILAEQLMGRLAMHERLVLTLSYSAGMSHSEIVIATGLPLGTIKSHINRAKQKLCEYLAMQEKTL